MKIKKKIKMKKIIKDMIMKIMKIKEKAGKMKKQSLKRKKKIQKKMKKVEIMKKLK